MKWLRCERHENVLMGRHILKEKAKNFTDHLWIENFATSEGSIQKFKKHHDLLICKLCGESASVKEIFCSQWKE